MNLIERARTFLEENYKLLDEVHQKQQYLYWHTLINFQEKKYKLSLEYLWKLENCIYGEDLLKNSLLEILRYRRLRLQLLYDSRQWTALSNAIKSDMIYIKRKHDIKYDNEVYNTYKEEQYNFLLFVKELFKCKTQNTELKRLSELVKQINAKYIAVIEKRWLLEKVEELKKA